MKKLLFFLLMAVLAGPASAQEIQARVTVMSNAISSNVNKKVFQTLQAALTNFVNNRRWTTDVYQPQERIKANFLITLEKELSENVYKATLSVQAARPIYNTTFESPLINFQDADLAFRYQEFQPIEFNENRIQGSDALSANLPAMLAYYINIILGLDYDSFSPRGGDPYFQKAQFIANNAPEGGDIYGWRPNDGIRNRFRLAENLVDSRFALVHDAVYAYYRSGFDLLFDNEEEGRNGVLSALNYLNTINQENPNSMILPVFFSGKSGELARLFSRAEPNVRTRARDLLLKLDVTNTAVYKDLR